MSSTTLELDNDLVVLYNNARSESNTAEQRQQALAALTAAADQGNSQAMMMRGAVAVYGGPGIPTDDGLALEYLSKAIDRGDLRAPMHLGNVYRNNGDYPKALKLMQTSAEAGLATAQFNFAEMLLNGEGCEIDIPRAALFARKAKDGGSQGGKFLYAKMLTNGQGMTANQNEAIRLLEELWNECSDAEAAEELGRMHYLQAESGNRDFSAAREWFKKAADAGLESAQDRLRITNFQDAFSALRYLELENGKAQFSLFTGTLESTEDKTRVIGTSSTSNTSGNIYNTGNVSIAHGSTTTDTTVHRQYDVQLNVRGKAGDMFSIIMDTESAWQTGVTTGDEVSSIHAKRVGNDYFFPVTFRSKKTGKWATVRDGIPSEIKPLIHVGTGSALLWAFAAFVCLLLTGATAGKFFSLITFGGAIWCGFRLLKAIKASSRAKRLERTYRAHVAKILDLESRLLAKPA